jgi:hypothetical protein
LAVKFGLEYNERGNGGKTTLYIPKDSHEVYYKGKSEALLIVGYGFLIRKR